MAIIYYDFKLLTPDSNRCMVGSGSDRFTKLAIGLLGTAHPRINILDTAVCITIKYTGFSPSFLFPAPCSLLPAP
ncbi:MAG: hypothetical protein F6K26_37985, partial [Moorea sp. SIO2I5]|nr:hypothetical protein [Moorena sp. SIO2I5]